ncbi:probable glucomannan 4-beta-mannosyltransferase 7 isoform X2 [Typha latifolia]|uniref:probable glucomannan 4-beta-mannosyltransferase 7 isoform X2 n=1 Tax=Typha latifolia TaxID=4733 RepID=UPI003C3082A8
MEIWQMRVALGLLLAVDVAVVVAPSAAISTDASPATPLAGRSTVNQSHYLQETTSWCLEFLDGLSPDQVYTTWIWVRSHLIAPVLQVVVSLCMIMSVMLVVEATYMTVVSLGVKLFGWKPEKQYKWEAIKEDDEELGSLAFPMVLIQIPMHNELEVYKLSIGAACGLTWPSDRIIIQVLDDSTNPIIKDLVELECKTWESKGVNIKYVIRSNRKGFKAGSLKIGMQYDYAQQCDFVAIFDADFQPEPDFLIRTIPFLIHNPKIALVQARWDFVNFNTSLITRIQKMSLDYHFKVEQESGSAVFAFFSFNGTAGVWRVSAINEAGGWKDRTTVEDMDLAVRTTLMGWKFLYVGDIKVKSELPTTFKAYCRQQHRWTGGAANLFRKMAWETVITKDVSLLKKFHMLYSFFFVRRVIAPTVAFLLYCVVLPISVMVPEVIFPAWGVAYIPTTLTILNVIRNPRSIHMMPFWILFESVMSMHRMKASMAGLLEAGNFDEWVVTKKVGDTFKENSEIPLLETSQTKFTDRVNVPELGFAVFLFFCASYDLLLGTRSYYMNLYLQGVAFLVLGFNFSGTFSCSS